MICSDGDAERDGDLRVVDESGEDDLFAVDRFVAIRGTGNGQTVLSKAS
jgi:hypothetical protein